MLLELNIQGLAIIASSRTSWGPGLNVVTGATGAGKSLLARAIQVLLGSRIQPEWRRHGAGEAWIEGLFALPDDERGERVRAVVTEVLGALPADGLLALTRVLDAGGRMRSYVNNRFLAREQVARISALLIDVHGQSEHQSLLRPAVQLELLDAFGGLRERRVALAALRERTARLHAEIAERGRNLRERRDREDLCRFHLREIEEVDPRPGEFQQLCEERALIEERERVRAVFGRALERLVEGEASFCAELGSLARSIGEIALGGPRIDSILERLEEARLQIEDAAPEMRSILAEVEDDERQPEQLEQRLALLGRLMERHDRDEDGLVRLAADLRAELDQAALEGERLPELTLECERLGEELLSAAEDLSRRRRQAAARLAKKVAGVLAELGMEAASFSIDVLPRAAGELLERIDPGGMDRVEYGLSANPGEPLRPLAEVASGGEMARTMLALKSVLSEVDAYPTLFFDEIDAEIGARMGGIVGQRLRATAADHQVICVTHLPAVAAAADHHFKVSKVVRKGRTYTMVAQLEEEQREEEIAEMIAGEGGDATARRKARELLEAAGGLSGGARVSGKRRRGKAARRRGATR